MPEITITGPDQWTEEMKVGVAKMYDVRVCAATGWSGTVVVQRRRSDQADDWHNVEGESYTGPADRVSKQASIHWMYRIGSPDGSGSIRAGIWTD